MFIVHVLCYQQDRFKTVRALTLQSWFPLKSNQVQLPMGAPSLSVKSPLPIKTRIETWRQIVRQIQRHVKQGTKTSPLLPMVELTTRMITPPQTVAIMPPPQAFSPNIKAPQPVKPPKKNCNKKGARRVVCL